MNPPFARFWTLLPLLLLFFGAPAETPAPPAGAAPAAAAPVGTIDGDFQVNGNGGANYQMEIEVPPGTAGVEPTLTINYDSQAPDGLLGIGFTLTGLSAVSRCPANVKLDGYDGGIYFNARDRFCLDGQRLILVSGGPYGAPSSVYHTETETWTEVVAQGTCGSGPCSFTARNKDGWRLDFGTAANSRVALPGRAEIATWQIGSSTDLNQNTVTVRYLFDSTDLQNHPAEILYTGNAATGQQPRRSVLFDYEARPDTFPRFVGGFRFQDRTRLARIRTEVSGTPVLEYRMAYGPQAPGTGRSRLQTISECAPDDSCLPPIRFTWQDQTNSIAPANSNPQGLLKTGWCAGADARVGSLDFNGDGKPDFHCDMGDGRHFVLLSTGTGLTSPNGNPDGLIKTGWCAGSTFHTSWIDFNGDGRGDLACDGDDGSHRVLLSTGTGLVSPNSNPEGLIKTNFCLGADCVPQWGNFNSDGRADLLASSRDGSQRVLVSNGTTLVSPNANPDGLMRSGWCTGTDAHTFWADFNGDGLSDIVCATSNGTQKVMISTGTAVQSPNSDPNGVIKTGWCSGTASRLQPTDFNGDGMTDLACSNENGTQQVLASNGSVLVSPNSDPNGLVRTGFCAGGAPFWGDWNGDGLADLACSAPNGDQSVLLGDGVTLRSSNSNPNGLQRSAWCTGHGAGTNWLDFNGDALGDVACHDSAGNQSVLVHAPTFPDLLASVENGIGGRTALRYKPMTDGTVYARGTPVAYPVLEVQTPLQMVAGYTSTDGRGGSQSYDYFYTGGLTHLELRRWLGFQSVRMTETANGRASTIRFTQDYPVIGFVRESAVTDAAGTLLATSRFTPTVLNPFPNVFAVLRETGEESTYTKGKADFTDRRIFRYDDHANLTLLSDLGDVGEGTIPVFSCYRYTTAPGGWGFGYVTADKIAKTEEGCRDFLAAAQPAWNPATDLRFNRYVYDAAMNQTEAQNYDDRNSVFLTTRRTYDSFGNVLSMTDPAARTTDFAYDLTYQLLAQQLSPPTTASGRLLTTFVYEPHFGTLSRETDPNGNAVEQRIDPFGRNIEVLGPDPDGPSGAAVVSLSLTSRQRDAFGVFEEVRERGEWAGADPATWFYSRSYVDGLERPIRTVERGNATGQDVITDMTYDSSGRLEKKSFPYFSSAQPSFTVTRYDVQNRPVTVTLPDGTVTRYDYIRGERVVKVTLAAGSAEARPTTYTENARGETTETVAADGGVATAVYDALSQDLTHTTAIGNVSSYTYDSLGRTITAQNSDTGTNSWTYAPTGDLASKSDGAGNLVAYQYDSLGRTTTQTVTKAGGAPETTTFTYDDPAFTNSKGNLTRSANPSAIQEYSYTRYAEVAGERLTLDGVTYVDRQTFDPGGRPSLHTYPDGSILKASYWVGSELNALDLQAGGTGDFKRYAEYSGYTALDQPGTTKLGNGLENRFTYFPIAERLGMPQSSTLFAGATQRMAQRYRWSRLGQMTGIEIQRGSEPVQTQAFEHTPVGFLSRATGPFGNLVYKYDKAGNLTEKDGVTYHYGANSNRMNGGSNGLAVGYDGAGNVSSKQAPAASFAYDYDGLGQMVAARRQGNVVGRMTYDVDGNRLRRADGNGSVSRYISDDFDTYEQNGQVYLTKYVRGPAGPVAAITTVAPAAKAKAAMRANAERLAASLYDLGTPEGLAGWATVKVERGLDALLGVAVPVALAAGLLAGLALAAFAALGRHRRRAQVGHGGLRRPLFAGMAPILVALLVVQLLPAPAAAELGPGGGAPVPGTLYFQGDALSSTVLVTNEAGAEVTRVGYKPFGSIDQAQSSGPNQFRPKFTTKELDDETGLYYFGSRYFDPVLGRFLAPDPQRQFDSPYVYGADDPESYFDADGELAALLVAIIVGAVIGAVSGAYFGGVAVNQDYNPANWDWKSAKTWGGIFAGAAIGAAGGAIGGAAAEAGVAPAIIGSIVVGAGENAAFTALGGGSGKEILEAALWGGVAGGVTAGAGAALSAGASRLGSRFARRGGAAAELGESQGGMGGRALNSVCSSFPAGTLVATADGALKPIETVKPGDQVLSRRDGPSEAPAPFPVTSCTSRDSAPLVAVHVSGETITTTRQHPFWVSGKGWTEAQELKAGDPLVTASGSELPIDRVEPAPAQATVFNFEVASAQTYFVSPLRILVHNPTCKLSQLPPTKTMTTLRTKALWKTKIKALVKEYGDGDIWYKDPPSGRRLLDLDAFAFSEKGKRAIVNLNKFGKGSTRSQHFSYADSVYSKIIKRKFKRSAKIQGQYSKMMEGTWHHHPTDKSMAFVPRGLHQKLGHAGGYKHLF